MKSVSPRPVIVRNHQTWSITPGMSFSVAEDIQGRVWIVEACPAGTQFWTLSQAAMLTGGEKTGDPLESALAFGRTLQERLSTRPIARRASLRFGLPTGKLRGSEKVRLSGDKSRNRELVGV